MTGVQQVRLAVRVVAGHGRRGDESKAMLEASACYQVRAIRRFV